MDTRNWTVDPNETVRIRYGMKWKQSQVERDRHRVQRYAKKLGFRIRLADITKR
jgi:hypothetical protein